MKKGFFFTREGELAIAGLLILIAVPIMVVGMNLDFDVCVYLGIAMVCAAMAFPPISTYIIPSKKK